MNFTINFFTNFQLGMTIFANTSKALDWIRQQQVEDYSNLSSYEDFEGDFCSGTNKSELFGELIEISE